MPSFERAQTARRLEQLAAPKGVSRPRAKTRPKPRPIPPPPSVPPLLGSLELWGMAVVISDQIPPGMVYVVDTGHFGARRQGAQLILHPNDAGRYLWGPAISAAARWITWQ